MQHQALPLVTNSRRSTWLTCTRKHEIAYTFGIRPERSTDAQNRGTVWHAVRAGADPESIECSPFLRSAVLALDSLYTSEFEIAHGPKGELLTEVPFVFDRGGYLDGGVIDAVVLYRGRRLMLERKTREGFDDAYRHRLEFDSQVTNYYRAALELGLGVEGVLYEVQEWPGLVPAKATPEDKRKWTKAKPCPTCSTAKAIKAGVVVSTCIACSGTGVSEPARLYANQREVDETPAEYGARVLEWAQEQPRLHVWEVAMLSQRVAENKREQSIIDTRILDGQVYRNTNACTGRGASCDYLNICTRNDLYEHVPDGFVRLEDINPEVSEAL